MREHINFFDRLNFSKYTTSQGAVSFADYVKSHADKKNPVAPQSNTIIQHPTGFLYLDYAAGSKLTVHDEKDGQPMFQYHNIGIAGGQVVLIIGKSQVGKTSVGFATGSGIIEPYTSQWRYVQMFSDLCKEHGIKIPPIENYPFIEIFDTEHTTSLDYGRKICRYPVKMAENLIKITDVITDRELMKALRDHIKFKTEMLPKIVMPMVDSMNRPIYNYPPTIILIDSLSNLLLEDAPEGGPLESKDKKQDMYNIYESAIQNTAGARKAKVLGTLMSYLVDYAKKYNILILPVSHITNALPGPTGIPTMMAFFLRAGENLSGSGGVRGLYLASSILRLDYYKGIGTEKSTQINLGEGVTGRVVLAQFAKCKTNSKHNVVKLAYTNVSGYDPLLSSLIQDKEDDALAKSGNFFYLRDYPEYKFSLKNYAEVFGDHPEMFTAYYDEVKERASKMLDDVDEIDNRNREFLEKARKDIHDAYGNGSSSARSDMMDLDDLLLAMSNNQ